MRDRFAGWTFDEDFVRAGEPELSAAERADAPPLLIASKATAPGERTVPRVDRDAHNPADEPRRTRAWIILAVVAVAMTVLLLVVGRAGGSYGAIGGADALTPTTPIGSCLIATYSVMPQMQTAQVGIQHTSCTGLHQYELDGIQTLSAAPASYPDDSYWIDTVLPQCQQYFAAYVGIPDGGATIKHTTAAYLKPSAPEWASGDRTVYCVAESSPPQRGSVRS
jgi:hypothetical protein